MSDFVHIKGPFSVSVTALRAFNLPKTDFLSKIDAYVQINSDTAHSSPVVVKNYNPVWDHEFPPINLDYKGKFSIKLFDWNSHSKPELVAKWNYSVMKLYESIAFPRHGSSSFDLVLSKKRLGKAQVHCRFQIAWPADLYALGRKAKIQWALSQDGHGTGPPSTTPGAQADIQPESVPVADQLRAIGCHQVFIQDLEQMANFDVIVICDDSESMRKMTVEGRTRWQELRANMETLVRLCCVLDDDGIDVLFLNRKGARHVKSMDQIASLFEEPPSGGTPMTEALLKAFSRRGDKPLLVVVATDGQPNDLRSFRSTLAKRNDQIYVTIIACTDNESDVRFLDGLDKELPRLDVLDDYESERAQIQSIRGAVDYTLGDHCARMLLGSVFAKYDNLDEVAW